MRKLLTVGILALAVTGAWAAPDIGGNQIGFRNWLGGARQPSLGLINPAKLTVNHTASFGFSSSGGASVMQSLYATQFGYQLSNPVTLTLLLGVQNSQVAGRTPYTGSYNSVFGGMALDYHASEGFRFHLEVAGSPFTTLPQGFGNRMSVSPVIE